MEILSFGVQAPGLDPGVGEMFRLESLNLMVSEWWGKEYGWFGIS